jgi:Glycosyl hydrolase-like 10
MPYDNWAQLSNQNRTIDLPAASYTGANPSINFMTSKNPKPQGCGCLSIPIIPLLILTIGSLCGGGWWLMKSGKFPQNFLAQTKPTPIEKPVEQEPDRSTALGNSATPQNKPTPPPPIKKVATTPAPLSKGMIGIYLSRYAITNNASEQVIRQRVRYYHAQGINTIVHGVWGNGCTMYNSAVTQKLLGQKSCPNLFEDQWLNWTIDEAHKQGMEVHAYFEKGIKIDKNSPIYNMAVQKNWLVPGVDKTYSGIDHYVLDVEIPEVATLFKDVVSEFVQKYPTINAVQWDDYLGYHAELPGAIDRTAKLTKFSTEMIAQMKQANPKVSFDICHHNPYWSKRYFAADWKSWKVDRAFIQAYNEKNFKEELAYAEANGGIAITDKQLQHLPALINNPKIKGIFIFPFSGNPEAVAASLRAAATAPAPSNKLDAPTTAK